MTQLTKKRSSDITLVEYQPAYLSSAALSQSIGERLWRQYDANGRKLQVAFPSPKTNQQWELISQGWVGHIPLTPDCHLHLLPKIPVANLFAMWAYAYQLQGLDIQNRLVHVHTLPDFFDKLASILAQLILRRSHLGFYHAYRAKSARLLYVKGRVDFKQSITQTAVSLLCRFDDRTMDIEDNQILVYTLDQIAPSGRCQPQTQRLIRRAIHALGGVSKRPFSPADCTNRLYTRLHDDYQPMHALCRFFLEHSGPSHTTGTHTALPFLINMARLYELFVAEWLKEHLPAPWIVKVQEQLILGRNNELQFEIDLVLYDEQFEPYAVLDTKYKNPGKPAKSDINQIITYAKAKNCQRAILIYPTPVDQPMHVQIGDIQLRTLTFAIDTDIDEAGHQFISQLSHI
jgi:5-methylcytosine-specific restriction enzyme subunit McrC